MVFITSDLFLDSTATNDHARGPHPHSLSTHTRPLSSAGLGKRKRHAGDGGHDNERAMHSHQWVSSVEDVHSRTQPYHEHHSKNPFAVLSSSNRQQYLSDARPVKQLKRLSPKAASIKAFPHPMDMEIDCTANSHNDSDLRPCHACNSAPKRKKDLLSYMSCQRCHHQTCYICARECAAGCVKAICKKCIVEVGTEGDSWCLDCYSRHINS